MGAEDQAETQVSGRKPVIENPAQVIFGDGVAQGLNPADKTALLPRPEARPVQPSDFDTAESPDHSPMVGLKRGDLPGYEEARKAQEEYLAKKRQQAK